VRFIQIVLLLIIVFKKENCAPEIRMISSLPFNVWS